MYAEHVTVTRPQPGDTSTDGLYAAGDQVEVYEGAADVQDGPQRLRRRGGPGTPETDADAVLFYPPGTPLEGRPDDRVLVRFPDGEEREATVAAAIRLDASLELRWVW